jgi:hypothetical protein
MWLRNPGWETQILCIIIKKRDDTPLFFLSSWTGNVYLFQTVGAISQEEKYLIF